MRQWPRPPDDDSNLLCSNPMRCFVCLSRTSPPSSTPRGEGERERASERGTCVQLPVTLVRFAYKRIYLAREDRCHGEWMHDTDSSVRRQQRAAAASLTEGTASPRPNEDNEQPFQHTGISAIHKSALRFAPEMRIIPLGVSLRAVQLPERN